PVSAADLATRASFEAWSSRAPPNGGHFRAGFLAPVGGSVTGTGEYARPRALTEAPPRGRPCYGAGSKGAGTATGQRLAAARALSGNLGAPQSDDGVRGAQGCGTPGGPPSGSGQVVVPPTARGPEGAHACHPWPQCSAGSAGAGLCLTQERVAT